MRTSIFITNVTVPHSWVLSRSAEPSFQLHYIFLRFILIFYSHTSMCLHLSVICSSGVFLPAVHGDKAVNTHIRKIKTKCAPYSIYLVLSVQHVSAQVAIIRDCSDNCWTFPTPLRAAVCMSTYSKCSLHNENCALLEHYAAGSANSLSKFTDKLSVPSLSWTYKLCRNVGK
jgi:hypothetical protein